MARIGITDNKKFRRLVRLLGIPEPYVLGLLEFMWNVAYQDTNPVLGSSLDVELAAKWPGETGYFTSACVESGFLEEDGGIFTIHDFWEHVPPYVLKRYKRKLKESQARRADTYIIEEVGQRPPTADNGRQSRPMDACPIPSHPIDKHLSTNVEELTTPTPITGAPRSHKNTPTETDLMVDYQTEVLNKLEGITTQTERKDRGALLKIARHVPTSIIKRALQDTQDCHQRGELKNTGAYLSSRVVTLCVQHKIKSPFAPEQKEQVSAHA